MRQFFQKVVQEIKIFIGLTPRLTDRMIAQRAARQKWKESDKRKKQQEKSMANRAHKKQKLQEEADSDKEEWISRKDQGLPFRKRKYAMMLMYSGKGYYGMQINKGFHTIEDDIIDALLKSDLVIKPHVTNNHMKFQRCARTDKGVSAAGQVCSLKMFMDVEDPVTKMNSHLPDKIRILDFVQVTKGFDSKNKCMARTYSYLCPTFAFTPVEQIVNEDFRITDDIVTKINKLLQEYCGTHNFHNYTSGKDYGDPSAVRYIMSFAAKDKYIFDGIEYLLFQVRGQSFLLHQIRKMIGFVIAIVRGFGSESLIELSWDGEKLDVPIAPGLGLMLEKPHFDVYNERFCKNGERKPVDLDLYKDEIEKFKREVILKEITETEKAEKSMMTWMQSLPLHTFDRSPDQGPLRTAHNLVQRERKLQEKENESNSNVSTDVDDTDVKEATCESGEVQGTGNTATCESGEVQGTGNTATCESGEVQGTSNTATCEAHKEQTNSDTEACESTSGVHR